MVGIEIKEIKRLNDGTPYAINVANEYDNLEIDIKWDGCINIRKYHNGNTPENYNLRNVDYIHICEVKEFIEELQDVLNIAKKMFGEKTFEENWK